jgi:hypothetical protein
MRRLPLGFIAEHMHTGRGVRAMGAGRQYRGERDVGRGRWEGATHPTELSSEDMSEDMYTEVVRSTEASSLVRTSKSLPPLTDTSWRETAGSDVSTTFGRTIDRSHETVPRELVRGRYAGEPMRSAEGTSTSAASGTGAAAPRIMTHVTSSLSPLFCTALRTSLRTCHSRQEQAAIGEREWRQSLRRGEGGWATRNGARSGESGRLG